MNDEDGRNTNPHRIGQGNSFNTVVLLMLSLVPLLSGCGDRQESARKELAKIGKDFTPHSFMNCIRDGDQMAVRLSIEAGMDVNKPDGNGFTPLMMAAWYGNADAAKLLMDKGANLTATLEDGRTAIRIAQERGHPELANLLAAKLKPDFFLGIWTQRTEISTVSWNFRADGTCFWHTKYSNNTEEASDGAYKVRARNSGEGRIVECSFKGDDNKPLDILLLVVGDRLYVLNNESDTGTDAPDEWLNRK